MYILIVDISAESFGKLVSAGYYVIDDNVWSYDNRKDKEFQSILQCLKFDISQVVYEKLEVALSSSDDRGIINDTICQILDFLVKKKITQNDPIMIVFNLMPFELRSPFFDKVIEEIFAKRKKCFKIKTVLFLLRSKTWLRSSIILQHFKDSNKNLPFEIMALDLSGYCYLHKRNHVIEEKQFSIELFGNVLDIDDKNIYNSLVFKTNHIIGHFALTNSHIRTHYNLNKFIKRDSVWIYIYQIIKEIIGDKKRVLLIGLGLEKGVVNYICTQISSVFGSDKIDYIMPSQPPEYELNCDDVTKNDLIIIITDIICSGKTVKNWLDQLSELNSNNKPIHVFSIARMLNTVVPFNNSTVTSVAVIRREYYEKDDCLLCRIKQPSVTVSKSEDFSTILKNPLTPYDFWEIVKDTQALVKGVNTKDRNLLYRIDSEKIIDRYGFWLKNIIIERFKINWTNTKVTALCVVKEAGGEKFAQIIAEALKVQKIVTVERMTLSRVTSSSGLPASEDSPFLPNDKVLVVDDGINYGKTLEKLINYCCAAGNMPIGAMVFDNRLPKNELMKIRNIMGKNHIVDLYNWPTLSNS